MGLAMPGAYYMTEPDKPDHDDKPCTCHSYNPDTGDKDEVGLLNQGGETVWIDACIAPVIKHLWDNEVYTEGSCCGHNGRFGTPSIVLAVGEENYSHIRELIAEKDDRYYELTQWKRVVV